ncbi:MAG: hypothetical protein WDW38_008765 [Sanguina aurantia]
MGDQPLHWAALYNRVGITKLLIAKNASVHSRNKEHRTPLHTAAEHNCSEVAAFLLAKGASLEAKDKDDDGKAILKSYLLNTAPHVKKQRAAAQALLAKYPEILLQPPASAQPPSTSSALNPTQNPTSMPARSAPSTTTSGNPKASNATPPTLPSPARRPQTTAVPVHPKSGVTKSASPYAPPLPSTPQPPPPTPKPGTVSMTKATSLPAPSLLPKSDLKTLIQATPKTSVKNTTAATSLTATTDRRVTGTGTLPPSAQSVTTTQNSNASGLIPPSSQSATATSKPAGTMAKAVSLPLLTSRPVVVQSATKAVPAALEGKAGSSLQLPRLSPEPEAGPSVFVSFRVAEADTEARWLKRLLETRGVPTFVSSVDIKQASPSDDVWQGDDWRRSVADALSSCRLMVVLGSVTYGQRGTSGQGTLEELVNAKLFDKSLFVFKMCEQYQCMVGSMELCGLQSTPWAVGEPLSKAGWHGLLGAVRGAGVAIKAQV